MAAALSSCCTSLFSVRLRYSHTFRPITSLRATLSSNPKSSSNRQRESGVHGVVVSGQRKKQSNSKDDRDKKVGPQPASSKSLGVSRKDKDVVVESKDKQVCVVATNPHDC